MRDSGGRGVLDSYVISLVVVVGLVANLNGRAERRTNAGRAQGAGDEELQVRS